MNQIVEALLKCLFLINYSYLYVCFVNSALSRNFRLIDIPNCQNQCHLNINLFTSVQSANQLVQPSGLFSFYQKCLFILISTSVFKLCYFLTFHSKFFVRNLKKYFCLPILLLIEFYVEVIIDFFLFLNPGPYHKKIRRRQILLPCRIPRWFLFTKICIQTIIFTLAFQLCNNMFLHMLLEEIEGVLKFRVVFYISILVIETPKFYISTEKQKRIYVQNYQIFFAHFLVCSTVLRKS